MQKATRLMLAGGFTLVFAPCQWAQEEQPAPDPGQEAAPAVEEPASTSNLIPDTRPLSGAEELRVETTGGSRNYAIPTLRISAFGDTNRTILANGQRELYMTGSVVAGLDVHRVNRKNDFGLSYAGGGIAYAHNSELTAMMHQLAITERYAGRRWGITLGDQLSYLPESSFGFGGFGSSMGMGGSVGGWNPTFLPGQSLYSGGGDRIYNAALAQVEFRASSRSTLTFGGTYGILRFKQSDLYESNSVYLSSGYNYSITRRDTLSINYGFGAIRYPNSDVNLDNHFFTVGYGRRLTGRLAFSVSGGPQLVLRRSPTFGQETTTDLYAHTSMDYQVGRSSLSWTYSHYTSNGSGLFLGAKTDYLSGSFSRRLTRNWAWSMGPGYSRNARLSEASGSANDSVFNSIYGNTSFHRNLGRFMDLSLSYNIYRQWSNATGTAGTNRTSSYLRHFFGVSMTWHGSRVGLD